MVLDPDNGPQLDIKSAKGGMCLPGDGSEGHGAGCKSFEDAFLWFDLVDRYRSTGLLEIQQASQRTGFFSLIVHQF